MTAEELIKLIATLLGDYAHGRDLDMFIVDTDEERRALLGVAP